MVATTTSRPWVSAPTATGEDGTRATFLGTGVVEQATTLAAGGVRTTRTETTYDPTYGTPVRVDDLGDTATDADDRCTRLEYARNVDANLTQTVARSETVAVACSATPSRPGDVISDTRTLYDGGAFLAAPVDGLPTTVQRLASYAGPTPVYVDEATSTYDAHGRVLTVTDALGRTTSTAYTPATGGPVTGTTTTSPDPDGAGPLTAHVTTTTVNPAWGAPTRVVDANGKVTTAAYDALGRLTGVWLPGRVQGTDSANLTYAYDIRTTGVNAVTTSTLTASETYLSSVALYDGLLRERQTQSPSMTRGAPGRLVTDKIYDSRGLVVTANAAWATAGAPATALVVPSAAVPARTRYVYDGAGRVTAEIFDVNNAERWRTTTTYGGDRVSVDPPAGAVPTTTISDARGQTVTLVQYLGAGPSGASQATSYAYDRAGRLAGMTDAAGNVWSYSYDLRGRQISATDPDRGTTTTTYDDAGQVTSVTDARGQALAYVYDGLGRRTQVRQGSASGPVRASWVFDTVAKGQVTSATRHDGSAQYVAAVTGYDEGYRPLGQSVTIPATEGALAGTYTTSYSYRPNGQLESVRLPAAGGLGAETVTTNYDSLSLPEWMGGGLGWGVYVANTVYSAYGEAVQTEYGNSYAIIVDRFLETGTRRLAGTSVLVEGDEHPVSEVSYAYDAAGNPVSIVDDPVVGVGDAQCFAYDGLRRLTQAWTPAGGDCAAGPSVAGLGGAAPYWFTDSFDQVGNRTARVSRSAAGATTTSYSYAPGTHQVTGVTSTGPGGVVSSAFAYDAAGNTTTRDVGDDAVQSLVWDVEGELAQVTAGSATDSYTYTADGDRLVRRQGGSTTVYLPGGQELTATGGTVTATRYYSFNGQVVAVRTGPGTTGVSTLVGDHHGTAGLSVANTTRVVTRRFTDPYGNPRGTAPASWAGDHGFLDKPVDDTGLVQVGARYYDPVLGRFVSVDPVMDLADPQQWHGYAYANNNPITWSDPTGLAPMIDGAWSAGAARAGKANPIKAQPASVQRRIPVTVVGLYFAVQGGAARAVKDAVVGTVQSLPPLMAYDWLQYARNDLGRDWAQMRSTPGGYSAWAGGRISDTWNSAYDAVTRPWRTGDAYGIADQAGYIGGMAAVTIGGGKVMTRGRSPAPRSVIVDTNAVYNKPGVLGALNAGEVPVVTGTTRAEIANLAAAGRMKPPGFAGELGTVPDIMDVNLRINIRTQLAELKPRQPGLFGDGAIGATAVRSGSSVITSDRTFAAVLRSYGVDVREP